MARVFPPGGKVFNNYWAVGRSGSDPKLPNDTRLIGTNNDDRQKISKNKKEERNCVQ